MKLGALVAREVSGFTGVEEVLEAKIPYSFLLRAENPKILRIQDSVNRSTDLPSSLPLETQGGASFRHNRPPVRS